MKPMESRDLSIDDSVKKGNKKNSRSAILSFSVYYLPGFKGGGPIRSVSNLLSVLGDEIDFFLVTSDRDLGDSEPYSGILRDRWLLMKKGEVYYASPGIDWPLRLWRIIYNFKGDAIHLNGFFPFRFSILPLLFWKIIKPRQSIIICPKGEFSSGALGFKSLKKNIYIGLTKLTRLYRNVTWSASSVHEVEDIRRVMGHKACIRIAPNIATPEAEFSPNRREMNTPLRVVFVSRISPMKNLLVGIKMLRQVKCSVIFDIYGPIEDLIFWKECQQEAQKLPPHVQFTYCDSLHPTQVSETLMNYDLFYLPTLGENYGHVIAEALGCGLPVLISDATPWRELAEKGLGWDISLDDPDRFISAFEYCSRMSGPEYMAWRHRIRSWALVNIGNDEAVEKNRQLFMSLNSVYEH